jgi:hypothetical protein
MIEYLRHDGRESGFAKVKDLASGRHNRELPVLPVSLFRLVGFVFGKHLA